MASSVGICNLALSFLGDSASVASIDPPEKSAQAAMCQTMYPFAKEAVLEMHEWSFAMRRVTLAKLASSEFGDEYQLPSDCLHVSRVYGKKDRFLDGLGGRYWLGVQPVESSFTIFGRTIQTRAANPVVEYVSSTVSEGQFSPTFSTALAYYLASQIAGERIKGKEGQLLAQNLLKQFQLALSVAKTRDASQQSKRVNFTPTWILMR